ncbi:DUF378 domain-containing protein [Clostridium sp. AL.422]|uniref:DUF378 domain-containing protein n=1 Tax=Clostridium TaxID=1485 RepID=UPI00293DA8C3|nr:MULTISPECIES: DUF378 domain-containing protein [unclassified Clostridium]MDV4151276.1 DUF378 domain-containing protein [Clostridium sp. AL.422]
MCKINLLDKISFFLVLLGAINWGLIGIFSMNIVSILVGGSVLLQRLVYIIIFAASIDLIMLVFKCDLFNISK